MLREYVIRGHRSADHGWNNIQKRKTWIHDESWPPADLAVQKVEQHVPFTTPRYRVLLPPLHLHMHIIYAVSDITMLPSPLRPRRNIRVSDGF